MKANIFEFNTEPQFWIDLLQGFRAQPMETRATLFLFDGDVYNGRERIGSFGADHKATDVLLAAGWTISRADEEGTHFSA